MKLLACTHGIIEQFLLCKYQRGCVAIATCAFLPVLRTGVYALEGHKSHNLVPGPGIVFAESIMYGAMEVMARSFKSVSGTCLKSVGVQLSAESAQGL